jgi:hypothetical protein
LRFSERILSNQQNNDLSSDIDIHRTVGHGKSHSATFHVDTERILFCQHSVRPRTAIKQLTDETVVTLHLCTTHVYRHTTSDVAGTELTQPLKSGIVHALADVGTRSPRARASVLTFNIMATYAT